MSRPRTPIVEYPPGYFCEPVYAWFPWFVPQGGFGFDTTAASESASRSRAAQVAKGNTGTIGKGGSRVKGDVSKAQIEKARR